MNVGRITQSERPGGGAASFDSILSPRGTGNLAPL